MTNANPRLAAQSGDATSPAAAGQDVPVPSFDAHRALAHRSPLQPGLSAPAGRTADLTSAEPGAQADAASLVRQQPVLAQAAGQVVPDAVLMAEADEEDEDDEVVLYRWHEGGSGTMIGADSAGGAAATEALGTGGSAAAGASTAAASSFSFEPEWALGLLVGGLALGAGAGSSGGSSNDNGGGNQGGRDPNPAPVPAPEPAPAPAPSPAPSPEPAPAPEPAPTPAPAPSPAPTPAPAPTPVEPVVLPSYPSESTVKTVVHDGTLTLDASIFTGSDAGTAPERIRISAINPSDPDGTTADVLYLYKDSAQQRIVRTGDEIDAADFAHLSWDASHNAGGSFEFVPVRADGSALPGATAQTVTVVEHPAIPVYPTDQPVQRVAHDAILDLDESLFKGTSDAPAFIRIVAVSPNDAPTEDAPALILHRGTTIETVLHAGATISINDFARLSWDAAHNTGGSFQFVPVLADGTPILGASVQTITVEESPLPPHYPLERPAMGVAHDASLALDASLFAGLTDSLKPASIRIDSIEPANGATGLMIDEDGPGGNPPRAVAVGETIDAADFDKLSWDAAGNEGGSFTFSVRDGAGKPILGADNQPITQTLDVYESPQAPDYSQPAVFYAAHDQAQTVAASMIEGAQPDNKPAMIRIDAITENPANGAPTALFYIEHGQRVTVAVDAKLTAEQYANLQWDSTNNEGGSFSFTPLDSEARLIEGAIGRTVTISEDPQAPAYGGTTHSLEVQHGASVLLGAEQFKGSDSAREPLAIRITAIDPSPQTTGPALTLDPDGDGSEPAREVRVGDVIDARDFDKLSWHAGNNAGGSFSFVPLTEGNRQIAGSETQTLAIIEHPSLPDYPASRDPIRIGHDTTLSLDQELFRGEVEDRAPSHIRITAIAPNGAAADAGALMIDPDGAGGSEAARAVTVGQIIAAADFDKLSWHGAIGDGGSFSFVPVMGNGTQILGSSAQTITISESVEAPDYPANRPLITVAHDGIRALDASLFTGDTDSRKPAAIRIESLNPHNGATDSGLMLDLDGPGGNPPRAVTLGETIDATHFDKLSWSASANEGGSFRFIPLDASAQTILSADHTPIIQQITLHESPVAPDYSGPSTLYAANDQVLAIDPAMIEGADAGNKPTYIRIDSITADPTEASAGALFYLEDGERVPVKVGDKLTVEQYAGLRWDSSTNNGGSFGFTPLDGSSLLIEGASARTVTISEDDPLAPAYGDTTHSLEVQHGASTLLSAEHFNGSDIARKPVAIRITAIEPTPAISGPALTLDPDGNGSQPAREVVVGEVIRAADFDKLSWHAGNNAGGSFSFVPLTEGDRQIAGSATQTLAIVEHPSLPDYPATREAVTLAFDATRTLDAALFRGDVDERAPGHIKITAIAPNDAAADAGALMITPDGAAARAVTVGEIIDADDFGKLSWNGAVGNGGSFSFVPVLANGNPILGSETQTITMYESPAAPRYPDEDRSMTSVSNGVTAAFDVSRFVGTANQDSVAAIRILRVTENDDSNPGQSALYLQAENGGNPEFIGNDGFVTVADLSRLRFETASNSGGSFVFVPLDAQGRVIEGVAEQTVTVHERPIPPAYADYGSTQLLRIDEVTTFDPTMFAGSVPARAPAYIWIEAVWETDDQDSSRSALVLNRGQANEQELGARSLIKADDFANISWDTTGNTGGGFQFWAVDEHQQMNTDSRPQTIRILETTPAPDYGSSQPVQTVAHDATLSLDSGIFSGQDAARAPTHIRITAINPTGAAANAGALTLDADGSAGPAEPSAVKVGDVIARADFDKLGWNAAIGNGGSFSFVPAIANGMQVLDSTEQTVRINESPEFPTYAATSQVEVGYQRLALLDSSIFTGTGGTPPARVRITRLEELDDTDTSTSALVVDRLDGSFNPIKAGDFIAAEDFGRVRWDATTTNGGSFAFELQQADGTPYYTDSNSIVTQPVIQITEGQPTTAGGTATEAEVVKNGTTFLSKDSFLSTGSGDLDNETRYFKIQGISAYEDPNGLREIDWHENELQETRTPPTAYELIKVDAGLSKAEAIERAREAGGKLWEIDSEAERLWVFRVLLNAQGLDENTVYHSGNDTPSLNAFIVEYENYKHPLRLHHQDGSTITEVHEGQVVGEWELSRLAWNTTANHGGTITFVEVEGRRVMGSDGKLDNSAPGNKPLTGATSETLTITELSDEAVSISKKSLTAQPLNLAMLIDANGEDTQAGSDEASLPGSDAAVQAQGLSSQHMKASDTSTTASADGTPLSPVSPLEAGWHDPHSLWPLI